MLKKCLVFIVIGLVGVTLALPATGHAWRHGGGWYGPGLFAGGLLLGAAIARPYYYAPAPVYAYPPPAVVYSAPPPAYVAPSPAYAYPDPAVSPPPAPSGKGQWVVVPGQTVNGQWVPEHKAWVPDAG